MTYRQSFILLLLILSVTSKIDAQTKKTKGAVTPSRTISADVQNIKGPLNKMFKLCVGAGRANEGLRADWQRQLVYVKNECDFKYIRMHGLLTDDMGIYQEDKKGNPIYNWQYMDELFDFLLSINIKPFVELGFMPNALASDKNTMFWWKGNITPPKDYAKWEALIKNLTLHVKERYGHDEVKSWYFEVWNEPNLKGLFFTGDMNEYFKMYASAAKAIKAVSKDYKVGGPATAGSAWIPEFIQYCTTNNVPVDFVSTHTYGVVSGFVDPDGNTGTVVSQNRKAVYEDIIHSKEEIKSSSKPNLELHYTEWSSSYTPTDPIHDSYHQAAYVLDKIKNTGTAATSMSYWVFTDIFEENGPRTTPFHGGFGLLNYQDIKKPAFYSYQFLNRLGDTEVNTTDEATWVCKDNQGNLQILFWDFTVTHPGDSVNNQVYYKRDLPSKTKGDVHIHLTNVPTGKYVYTVYKTGYRTNDAYATYLDLGSPNQLSKEQVKTIKELNDGKSIQQKIISISTTGLFDETLNIRENDVYMIVLNKL